MLIDLIQGMATGDAESIKWALAGLMLCLPIVVLALSVHETAHGYVAYKLGDPTARSLGRLSLNPLKHLDPMGFLCMVAFGFGWARPVPVNSRYFKKPKRNMALCAVAGPASNVLLAFVFALLMKLTFAILPAFDFNFDGYAFVAIQLWLILLELGVSLNISLAVFNLIPIPPLDGSKILYMFLPPKVLYKFLQYERQISLALLLLVAFGALSGPLSMISGMLTSLIFLILGM